jgi:hypothetical protein
MNFRGARGCRPIAIVLAVFVMLAAGATAQTADFTLQMSTFSSLGAVDPGGTATSNLTISPLNGFTGSVSLSCSISPPPANGNAGCLVSPTTLTPPNGASVTVSTLISSGVDWSPNLYTITITATAPGAATQSAYKNLSVLSVVPAFTITLQNPVAPTSVPAGSSATATIVVTPINGYTTSQNSAGITLACTSVSPVVVSPPVCTFSYPDGLQSLPVTGDTPVSSTLTITTIGPLTVTTQAAQRKMPLYALWMPLPMLALFGVGAALGGKRSRVWAVLGLFVMSGIILLIPACSTTTTPTAINSSDIITPNGTYTFTVTGIDENGNQASNGTASAITLTVTTAVN